MCLLDAPGGDQQASSSAPELTLRGWDAWSGPNDLRGVLAARRFFGEALQLDPKFMPAIWAYVWSLVWEGFENPSPDRDRLAREADALSGRAIAIDYSDIRAWRARTWALAGLGRWDEAMAANDRREISNQARPLL